MSGGRAFTLQAGNGALRRAATQQQIVDALQRLLERGTPLAALSVDRIATEAGVSRSTFYLHFPDKRNLIARLAEQELSDWRQISAPLRDDPHLGREVGDQIVRETIAAWRKHAAVVSGIIELSEYDPQAREAWRGAVESLADTVAQHLRARWDGRDPFAVRADLVASILVWMIERVCHQTLRDTEADDAETAAALAEIVWRVIEPAQAAAALRAAVADGDTQR